MTDPDKDAPSFADMVGKVRRLHFDGVEPPPRRSRQPSREQRRPVLPPDEDSWTNPSLDTVSEAEDDFCRSGVQDSVMRKLRRGRLAVADELDLHGLHLGQARSALAEFLDGARASRLQCVRVIHGKGLSSPGARAVLKPHVRHWLRQDPRVLAYAAVKDRSGGSGAVDVLLRSTSRVPGRA